MVPVHLWTRPLSTVAVPQASARHGCSWARGHRAFTSIGRALSSWPRPLHVWRGVDSGTLSLRSLGVQQALGASCLPVLRPRISNNLRTQRTLGPDSWPHDLGLPAVAEKELCQGTRQFCEPASLSQELLKPTEVISHRERVQKGIASLFQLSY